MGEKEYLYWLCRIQGLGAVKLKKLWEYAGGFENVYNMKEQDLEQVKFLNARDRIAIGEEKKNVFARQEEYHRLETEGIQFITPMDSAYPERLKPLYDMPMGLFVKGSVPEDLKPSVAIIGARSCTFYGKEQAEYLGRELAGQGIQIISGLAYGIDGAGHKGALSAGGATYAILGSGIDICYPRENRGLYHAITRDGGLISEYGPGESPKASHFPVRNRIISGLSDVVIVVEARKRSGSLITVGQALEQGKEVFALPGRLTDPLSSGCNELIQTGASMLLSPQDVLEFLCIKCEKILKQKKNSVNGLANKEKMVYSCLDSQPMPVEEVVNKCGLPAGECMTVLLKLEMDGKIVQTTNQYYMKKLE